jgi:hypothetical protein
MKNFIKIIFSLAVLAGLAPSQCFAESDFSARTDVRSTAIVHKKAGAMIEEQSPGHLIAHYGEVLVQSKRITHIDFGHVSVEMDKNSDALMIFGVKCVRVINLSENKLESIKVSSGKHSWSLSASNELILAPSKAILDKLVASRQIPRRRIALNTLNDGSMCLFSECEPISALISSPLSYKDSGVHFDSYIK